MNVVLYDSGGDGVLIRHRVSEEGGAGREVSCRTGKKVSQAATPRARNFNYTDQRMSSDVTRSDLTSDCKI